jgi:uncharacterized repeat protein (TIGR03943 family)
VSGGVSSTILLLFGVALVKLGISDELMLYVRPAARPWVLLAGIALVVLAGWSLLSLLRGHPAEPEVDATPETQVPATDPDSAAVPHGHGHGAAPKTGWLVLAPVLAILIVAPPALGAFTANRAPAVNAAATGRTASLVAGTTPVQLPMLSFLLLSTGKPAALTGRQVTLEGFVRERRPGGFALARLVITCCAADASTATVNIHTSAAPPIGSWVRVTGTFAGMDSGAGQIPSLAANSVTAIAQPKDPYD